MTESSARAAPIYVQLEEADWAQRLHRVEIGETLRFVLGPALYGLNVRLWTTHPAAPPPSPVSSSTTSAYIAAAKSALECAATVAASTFGTAGHTGGGPREGNNGIWRVLEWTSDPDLECGWCSKHADLAVWLPGPFRFYFEVDPEAEIVTPKESMPMSMSSSLFAGACAGASPPSSSSTATEDKDKEISISNRCSYLGHFLVDPVLGGHDDGCSSIISGSSGGGGGASGNNSSSSSSSGGRSNNNNLPIDALCIQTLMPHCLGRITDWKSVLRVSAESGYNMVHFTPVQARGASGSAYSLRDQNRIDPAILPPTGVGLATPPVPSIVTIEQQGCGGGASSSFSFSSSANTSTATTATPTTAIASSTSSAAASTTTTTDVGEATASKREHALLGAALEEARRPPESGGLGLLSMVDCVWNHTATDSPWLASHPEAGYSLTNSAHLKPAYVLDRGLALLSAAIACDNLVLGDNVRVSPTLKTPEDVDVVVRACRELLLPKLRLHEFYTVDVSAVEAEFCNAATALLAGGSSGGHAEQQATKKCAADTSSNIMVETTTSEKLPVFRALDGGRHSLRVDVVAAAAQTAHDLRSRGASTGLDSLRSAFLMKVHQFNAREQDQLRITLDEAMLHLRNTLLYERLDARGPRYGHKISETEPIMSPYFTAVGTAADARDTGAAVVGTGKGAASDVFAGSGTSILHTLAERCPLADAPDLGRILAHNGWIWDADPLVDFASPDSNAYLARRVIVWDDSVKLRYGRGPEDSPWLWTHMIGYTRRMAALFDGIRIDNCHSTPIHVGAALVAHARAVNPNLFVMAELFTGSEAVDTQFTNALGLNALIREGMAAGDAREASRLVHRYGGAPIGSLRQLKGTPRVLTATLPHAVMMDATHDNETPFERYGAGEAALSLAALNAMACTATGSVRGFDELVARPVRVVGETRTYSPWATKTGTGDNTTSAEEAAGVLPSTGIIRAKALLNRLHSRLAREGYSEVFVDHIGGGDSRIVAITRHNPATLQRVLLVANTVYSSCHLAGGAHPSHPLQLEVDGMVARVLFSAVPTGAYTADCTLSSSTSASHTTTSSAGLITGGHIPHVIEADVLPEKCALLEAPLTGPHLHIASLPPGAVLCVSLKMMPRAAESHKYLTDKLTPCARYSLGIFEERLTAAATNISLLDLNYALYRCAAERGTKEAGLYELPGGQRLLFAGLQGVVSATTTAVARDDLGGALCSNLRDGDWLAAYCVQQLTVHSSTRAFAGELKAVLDHVTHLPRPVVPVHTLAILCSAHRVLLTHANALMMARTKRAVMEEHDRPRFGDDAFVRGLSLTSIQLYGHDPHDAMAAVAVTPATSISSTVEERNSRVSSPGPLLAAGLPHFAAGWARCWGRDTFLALRGLLLVTGRLSEARDTLLLFAATLRHGLIPNLLDGARRPRYNCRDASWLFIQAIRDYCDFAGALPGSGGPVTAAREFLSAPVRRRFPSDNPADDAFALGTGPSVPLSTIVQEIIQRHAMGISFTEWTPAGGGGYAQLDRDMTRDGFRVEAFVDWRTGFVCGGNPYNCGTWMDKMGSSNKAGNAGIPATPRDGAAIEIVALAYSAVEWLTQLHAAGAFPHAGVHAPADNAAAAALVEQSGDDGVSRSSEGGIITWTVWSTHLRSCFEAGFWVPTDPSEDAEYSVNAQIVHRRGMYRDTVGASADFADYQLRPNFAVAMVVAPALFAPAHARAALNLAHEALLGGMGMRTLDPRDWAYRPSYAAGPDTDDRATSKGWNYHQGPEWLWPVGFYWRARLLFAEGAVARSAEERAARAYLRRHVACLAEARSHWQGLPELFNEGGSPCPDSCPSQAWSSATLLDLLYDMTEGGLGKNSEVHVKTAKHAAVHTAMV